MRPGDRADRHVVAGRAEHVPQPPARLALEALDEAEVAGALEGPDRLAAVLGDDRLQAAGDGGERLVPADALEAPLALAPDALERVQDAVRRGGVVQIAVDLRAQGARGERMVAVPAQLHGLAVLDRDDPAARVRAVEWAGAEDLRHAFTVPWRGWTSRRTPVRCCSARTSSPAASRARERDPQRRWLLRRPRAVRRSFVAAVVDGDGERGALDAAAGRRDAAVLRRRSARRLTLRSISDVRLLYRRAVGLSASPTTLVKRADRPADRLCPPQRRGGACPLPRRGARGRWARRSRWSAPRRRFASSTRV